MPKDHWKRENERIAARRAKSEPEPRLMRFPSERLIPVGTSVLVRKNGSDTAEFKQYVTRSEVRFTYFLAATKAAVLVEHDGWQIWVKQSLLVR